MSTLREQLARKHAHNTTLTFPIGIEGETAKTAVAEAEKALLITRNSPINAKDRQGVKRELDRKNETVATLERQLEDARADLAGSSLTLRFRGLTEEERDALMSAHPATEEEIERHKQSGGTDADAPEISRRGFLPAALAVCVLDSDLTEAEWAEELASDRWTAGEALGLYEAVVNTTNARPAAGLGKGSAPTR